MTARRTIPREPRATETSAHDDWETDDDVVRAMQDELHEAGEKLEAYRSDAPLARTLNADLQNTETKLATLSRRIAARRAEIEGASWACENLAGIRGIQSDSHDSSFESVRTAD